MMKVLVTGASKGIGRALARELCSAGCQVWGVARSADALQLLEAELGGGFRFSVADLSTRQGVTHLVAEMVAAGFAPQQVFLVAGVYSTADATFSSTAHQQTMLAANYQGPVWLYEALASLPVVAESVVVVSSVFALLGDNMNPSYAEAKSKLAAYFLSPSLSGPSAIKVVYLGSVNTAINQHAKRGKGFGAVEPTEVAQYLAKLPRRPGNSFIYPWSARLFYQLFRYLPKQFYITFMNQVRR